MNDNNMALSMVQLCLQAKLKVFLKNAIKENKDKQAEPFREETSEYYDLGYGDALEDVLAWIQRHES